MVFATPVIRGLESGGATIQHGAELTIQGAGFGDKVDAEFQQFASPLARDEAPPCSDTSGASSQVRSTLADGGPPDARTSG